MAELPEPEMVKRYLNFIKNDNVVRPCEIPPAGRGTFQKVNFDTQVK